MTNISVNFFLYRDQSMSTEIDIHQTISIKQYDNYLPNIDLPTPPPHYDTVTYCQSRVLGVIPSLTFVRLQEKGK